MKLSPLLRTTAAALAITLASTAAMAQVAFSSLKLEFTQPTGTVLATDAIPVYVTLTNTDATQAFVFDNSLPLAGLNPADVPTSAYVSTPGGGQTVPFASYTPFRLSLGYGCSGDFTMGCDEGPYRFDFADGPFSDPYSLAPGATHTYLFGTFTPVGGSAPGGTYEFYRSLVWLDVNGLDANGDPISSVVFPASTCAADTAADCNAMGMVFFTRDVVAVPEPASAVLLGFGLMGLAGFARRRGKA